jgi:hypothetical protein
MRRTSRVLSAVLLAVSIPISLASFGREGRGTKSQAPRGEPAPSVPDEPIFTMAPAVACSSIAGYEDYKILPGAALTSDEKLLVYYRPLNYQIEQSGSTRHIHLIQDAQIRRRGEKAVLMIKLKLVDYEWKSDDPERTVYIRNIVSLKGLKPGKYDYGIILHDKLAPGEPTARQTLPFRVIPPGPRKSESGGG